MPTLTRPYLNRMNIGRTTWHFFLFFAQDTYFFCLFFLFFLSMKIRDKHGTHGFYDVSRYPRSQPHPHYAFPWLLDKLRWTKAIVTAVIFWSKIGLGFWEPDSKTPPRIFRSTPRETWSLVASLPVSNEHQYDHFNTIILDKEIDASFTFAFNLNEAKNGRFVSTTPWLYTAKHRKQRFEARTSTQSAKSTLMI